MMKVAAMLPLSSPSVSTKVPRIGLEKRMKGRGFENAGGKKDDTFKFQDKALRG